MTDEPLLTIALLGHVITVKQTMVEAETLEVTCSCEDFEREVSHQHQALDQAFEHAADVMLW